MSDAKPTLLLVDDEERILRSLAMLFRGQYKLLGTTDPAHALTIVNREPVHVIVSDQRMPQMRGAELLRRVREDSPNTMRLLLTGYSELDAVVASVNEGEIFRFITKPWDATELRETVRQAADISRSLMLADAAPAPPTVAPTSEAVLVIDDDAEVVRAIEATVAGQHPVHWAQSLDAAMALLERHPIGVIVSELRVGRDSVGLLLKLLKAQHPDVVTMVLTPFQDVSIFIGLINQGQVYRLLPKPVRRGPLGISIASALKHHRHLKQAPKLQAAYQVQKPAATDEGTGNIATRVMDFLGRLRHRETYARWVS